MWENEIETVQENAFWKYAVPVFLVLVVIALIVVFNNNIRIN